jgi:electron transfer flavoprotein alpha subunit
MLTPSNFTPHSLEHTATMLARLAGLRSGLRAVPTATTSSRLFSTSPIRSASTLLFIEHKNGTINPGSLVALTAAGKIGGDVDGLVVGAEGIEGVVDKALK